MGLDTGDDAAVYRLNGEIALVQTVDFFPPIVDDPYMYGQIAAANAFSDVYAMGGKPLLALNIVGFPSSLPNEILEKILEGGTTKAEEAGVMIVGGHTVIDAEPKYGMAVTGIVKPGEEVSNSGAIIGDALILTKPIGTGIVTTAAKRNFVPQTILNKTIKIMSNLNKTASEIMIDIGVNACVDVTGYGLLGHMKELLENSGVGAKIRFEDTPILEGVWDLLKQEMVPGGTRRNLEALEHDVTWNNLEMEQQLLMCDAQTSGGLLISVSQKNSDRLIDSLSASGVDVSVVIGTVVERETLPNKRMIEMID